MSCVNLSLIWIVTEDQRTASQGQNREGVKTPITVSLYDIGQLILKIAQTLFQFANYRGHIVTDLLCM